VLDIKKSIEDAFALTPAQAGMLFHSYSSDTSDDYLSHITLDITGDLNIEHFKQAWHTVFCKHTALRLTFVHEGLKSPLQLVNREVSLPWKVVSATAVGSEKHSVLQQHLREEHANLLPLDVAPLCRFTLLCFDNSEFVLIWTVHHLIADGASIPVIMEDLLSAYSSIQRGDQPNLSVEFPYKKFVVYQGQLDHRLSKAYWEHWLSDKRCSPLPLAPVSQPDISGETSTNNVNHLGAMSRRQCVLDAAVSEQVRNFCRKTGVTENTLIMAAWALTIRSAGAGDTPLFGMTVSGRPHALTGAEAGVGLYINTLPFSVDCRFDVPLGNWLKSIQDVTAEHSDHDQMPYRDIQVLGDIGQTGSLFDTIVAFEGHDGDLKLRSDDERLCIGNIDYAIKSHVPISMLVMSGETFKFTLVSDTTLVSAKISEFCLNKMVHHIASITSGEHQHLASLLNVSDALIQRSFNVNVEAKGENVSLTLTDMIERTATAMPEVIAVQQGSRQISFGDLDRRANQVAEALIAQGVKSGVNTLVALLVPSGIEQVIGMLAILKAGAAYVPIDPTYPQDRIQFMLESAGVQHVVVEEHASDLIDERFNAVSFEQSETYPSNKPAVRTSPNHLAYVMYTSGSTGEPKAVEITHSNVIFSTHARMKFYDCVQPRFLLLSSISFDSSVAGIFWSLCGGGTLVLPEVEQIADIPMLCSLIKQQSITHTLCLPSVYSLLLEFSASEQISSLECVIVAGETCHRQLAPSHFRKLPRTRLFNEYGPTEACVWASVYEITPNEQGVLSIGKPIPGCLVDVESADNLSCVPGLMGELVVYGAGVGNGYHQMPDATAEKFIWKTINGIKHRGYRTGDKGYYDEQGNLYLLGRIDRQIKIRGFRVEPAEVESIVLEHPEVREVCITLDGGSLTGFYLSDSELKATALSDHLRLRIPPYMLPSNLYHIDVFPRLPNGKVDIATLVNDYKIGSLPTADSSALTELEESVLLIARDILKTNEVLISDGFVSAGGDSISAMRFCAQLQHVYSVRVPIRQLFECDSIRQLCRLMELSIQARNTKKLEPHELDSFESGEI